VTLTTGLIPLSGPGTGQQYAFAIDLDTCTGCKSCVAACHRLNGLDDGEVAYAKETQHARGTSIVS